MKLNKLFLGLAAVGALSFAACSDDDIDYQRGTWDAVDGYADIYFDKAVQTPVELDPTDPLVASFKVYRHVEHKYTWGKTADGTKDSITADEIVTPLPALTVKMNVVENTDNIFQVADATFAQGDTVATVNLTFNGAKEGVPYKLTIDIQDPQYVSKYSNATSTSITVTRVKWNDVGYYIDENGQKVEGWGMYTDVMCGSWFGGDDLTFPTRIQERDDKPGYFRLVNTYDYHYPYNDPTTAVGAEWQGAGVTREDCFDYSKDYYIYIDATNPKQVYIPEACDLGSDWGYGNFIIFSYAGYRLANGGKGDGYWGTYENGKITFPAGSILRAMTNYNAGSLYVAGNGLKLVIDPSKDLYRATVNTDFEYNKLFDGVLISEKLGTTTEAALYEGTILTTMDKCDSVFAADWGKPYIVKDAYAKGYDLLFCAKGEEVKIPVGYELQNTGLQAMGEDVYAKISTMSSYAPNYVSLVITFQNKKGTIEYGTTTEVVANLTYKEVGTGAYTYGVAALSQDAESFYEGAENSTLYQCEQLPGSFYLKPWANSEEGLNFTLGKDGYIRFYQFTGDSFTGYGDVYFIDIEAYNPNYTQYLGGYDAKTGTFTFNGIYYIPGAGGFGLITETFVLGAEAPAEARSVTARELGMKLDSSMKAASRFVPNKVEKSARKAIQEAASHFPVLN